VTAYVRFRMFWGALDVENEQAKTPGYGSTQIVSGGESAVIGSGVGVRRVTLVVDRTGVEAGSDVATMHFDFLNMTGGSPDDTWITSDFTTLEGLLSTWITSTNPLMIGGYKITQFIWHRVGSGVTKPNPAERILVIGSPLTGAGSTTVPQVASSITFRTGVRKSWGRTYFPWGKAPSTAGRPSTADVDTLAAATNTLINSAASSDFHLVVVSKPLASSLNVERIEVDNTLDIIRRRRWKQSTYKKLLP
jgi:hypothetical protein